METDPQDLTFRQVRNVSGFSRPMSVTDAFIYNFLAMGVIFPWTYLWGPASFPGANIEIGICLALLAQIPISLAYCFLSTVLPVTGGDYVFQTRAFGKWGFISVFSGFVIWILQWIALSGWLLACLGLAPLFLCLGVFFDMPVLSQWGVRIQTPMAVSLVSVILSLGTTIFLIRGLRLYVRTQRFLFVATLSAVLVVIYIYVHNSAVFSERLNSFVNTLLSQLGFAGPEVARTQFTEFIKSDVQQSGFNIFPKMSWLATLGIVPIAWTSLQWATYSVEQSTEIAEADKFRKQLVMLVASACAVTVCLVAVAYVERVALSRPFLIAASAAYWLQQGSTDGVSIVKTILQPFPNVLAMAVSGSVILVSIVAIGFIANSFQVTCNCFIGVTRILVAMSNDGLFPRRLEIGTVDSLKHSPVTAHWLYFALSIPWIVAYNYVPDWTTYSLGVTFACGYVFSLSALACAWIPTRMSESLGTSNVHHVSSWVFKVVGWLGFASGGTMVLVYLILPQLGLTGKVPYLVVLSIITVSYVIYADARNRNPLVAKRFEAPPDEIHDFYRDPT